MAFNPANNKTALLCLEYIYRLYTHYKCICTTPIQPITGMPPLAIADGIMRQYGGPCAYVDGQILYVVIPGISNLIEPTDVLNVSYDYAEAYGIRFYAASLFKKDLPNIMLMIYNLILQISKIRITSLSYGGSLAYPLGYILSRLTAYHGTSNSARQVLDCVRKFYSDMSSTIIDVAKLSANKSYINALNLPTNPSKNQILERIMEVDKAIFGKVKLNSVYTFASPAFFTYESCDIYDDNDRSDIQLRDITFSYGLANDPIFNVLGMRTGLGSVLWLISGAFSHFKRRAIPGLYIDVPTTNKIWQFWYVDHDPGSYYNRIYQLVDTKFTTYNYLTTPLRLGIYLKFLGFILLLEHFAPEIPMWVMWVGVSIWSLPFVGILALFSFVSYEVGEYAMHMQDVSSSAYQSANRAQQKIKNLIAR